MRPTTALGALLCVSLLCGCDEARSPDGPTFAMTDSAGIQVVTNHSPAWSADEVWRFSRRPTLVVGDLDGPLEFTFGNVRSVGWLPDGRVFVGDEQAHTIRIFSATGDFLETVGREGYHRGPEEHP